MISHFQTLTPTASFVYTNLFINDTVDNYDIPRMLHIVNHHTTDVAIILNSKLEGGSDSTGIVLAPEDILDIEAMDLYSVGVKYLSAGTGDIFVSGYNYFTVTK